MAQAAEKPKMQYTRLGKSGLQVSRIAFGNWINNKKDDFQETTIRLVKQAWDLGINYFDTAELYGQGEAEKQFAVALKSLNVPRHSYVLVTKIFWGPDSGSDPNDIGLSRKHVIEGLKNSLKRLEHDYVDVVFAHRFDEHVDLEEVCRAFDWVVKQGYAHYWGTSEWTASQIFEAFFICQKYNLTPPIAEQCQYNLLYREKVDLDYARLFDIYQYGTTVWSPLSGGLLSGKYNEGIPEDSRLSQFTSIGRVQQLKDDLPKLQESLKQLGKIAERLGASQAQLAMAWVLKSNDVSTAIAGASRESQLIDVVGALQLVDKLTPEILEEIEAIFNTRPTPLRDWRYSRPVKHRR